MYYLDFPGTKKTIKNKENKDLLYLLSGFIFSRLLDNGENTENDNLFSLFS